MRYIPSLRVRADLSWLEKRGLTIAAPTPATAPRTKYGNTRVEFQGQRFDSKHELRVWQGLKAQQVAGEIRAVIRQVSLTLPDSTRRIRLDFLLIENDGRYRWIDAKGFATAAWLAKADQIRQAYGIQVELAFRGEKFAGEPCGRCQGTLRYRSNRACVCCAKTDAAEVYDQNRQAMASMPKKAL